MSAFLKENKEGLAENMPKGFQIMGKACISILIFYYMFYNEKYGHNTVIVYGSFLTLAVCVLIDILVERHLDLEEFHIGIWVNFLIGFYALITGIFVAYDQGRMLANTRLVLQYAFIIFAIYYYARISENGLEWVLLSINASALLCSYFLFTQPFQKYNGRYSLSLTNNPNALGIILAVGIFVVAFRIKPNSKKIILDILQMGIMFYGVIMTGSRKSLIAALIIVVLSIVEILRETNRTTEGWIKYLVIITILVIALFGAKYLYRFYQQSVVSFRMNNILDDDGDVNRLLFYRKAIEIFLDKPLFGGGLEQFIYWSGTGSYAHSTYAEAIADFGLIGCLMYFYPIILTGYRVCINAISGVDSYKMRLILILYLAEMFIGAGQIFFLDFVHYIIWFILFFSAQKVYINRQPSLSKYIL